jgi:DNA-binding MarR family transcriptional regulator
VEQQPGPPFAPRLAPVLESLRELSWRSARFAGHLAHGMDLHQTDLVGVMAVHQLTAEHAQEPTAARTPVIPAHVAADSSPAGALGPTIGQLGERLELSSAATTGLVDRLERAGHVERVRDPADRRRIRLRATGRSERLAAEMLRGYLERLGRVLDEFDDAELDAADRVLRAAIDAMEHPDPRD